MLATELYNHLLGILPPWKIVDVSIDHNAQRIDLVAEHDTTTRFPCPACGQPLPVYDHAPRRAWRHRHTCEFLTFLHASLPRVACPQHAVLTVAVPWATPLSRFTLPFERWAITVLAATDIQAAAGLLRISWDQAWGLMERAVARGLQRKRRRVIPFLGIDEKAVGKGQEYFTLVMDLTRSTVEYIGEGRSIETLDRFYEQLSPRQLDGIEGVAMDMWQPYIAATLTHVPGAEDKIVFDRYHIMTHANDAVDDVRKKEQRHLRAQGASVLSGTKHLWLYAEENVPVRHRERFRLLKRMHLKTSRAWAMKEMLRDLWRFQRRGWALRHFRSWYGWAMRSRLEPMRRIATMLSGHLANILPYFTHRITNAVSEGLNNKIEAIKHSAFGFRNRDHFRTAIFFHCGGLNLFPTTH
jgi:transposase